MKDKELRKALKEAEILYENNDSTSWLCVTRIRSSLDLINAQLLKQEEKITALQTELKHYRESNTMKDEELREALHNAEMLATDFNRKGNLYVPSVIRNLSVAEQYIKEQQSQIDAIRNYLQVDFKVPVKPVAKLVAKKRRPSK